MLFKFRNKNYYWDFGVLLSNLFGLLIAALLIGAFLLVSTIEFRGL